HRHVHAGGAERGRERRHDDAHRTAVGHLGPGRHGPVHAEWDGDAGGRQRLHHHRQPHHHHGRQPDRHHHHHGQRRHPPRAVRDGNRHHGNADQREPGGDDRSHGDHYRQ